MTKATRNSRSSIDLEYKIVKLNLTMALFSSENATLIKGIPHLPLNMLSSAHKSRCFFLSKKFIEDELNKKILKLLKDCHHYSHLQRSFHLHHRLDYGYISSDEVLNYDNILLHMCNLDSEIDRYSYVISYVNLALIYSHMNRHISYNEMALNPYDCVNGTPEM